MTADENYHLLFRTLCIQLRIYPSIHSPSINLNRLWGDHSAPQTPSGLKLTNLINYHNFMREHDHANPAGQAGDLVVRWCMR